jgi:predicted GTPase
MKRERVVILGAAGRDFHNFSVVYRADATREVIAFTAQQIPHIADRRYPAVLAGPHYPQGIPIHPEDELESLIAEYDVDVCVISYSDLAHEEVMHLASRANAAGASFTLLGARQTMLKAAVPVVAVCASRTGAGKSQTSRAIVRILRGRGMRVGILRHPMPYGDLAAQRVQRFANAEDLASEHVTIEEREEYEPHIAEGSVVWAGVDYEAILRQAEAEADVLIWDGGNNDTSFLVADVYITVVDPHRPGHELTFYPGETNLRLASAVLINKIDTAKPEDVERVRINVQHANPRATITLAASPLTVDDPTVLRGKRVLAIEDGPTVTHGGMPYGAATIGARQSGAAELVDPRAFAVGELADTFEHYPAMGPLLPAMGYGDAQIRDLEATLAAAAHHGVEGVAIGTPINLARLVTIPLPHTRVRYELRVTGGVSLETVLRPILQGARVKVSL